MSSPFDARDLRTAFGKFATGVTIVTTRSGSVCHGMTANSFTSVSLAPPMLLVCIANSAKALDIIASQREFGISVLTQDQCDISNHFAGRSTLNEVRFASLGGIPTIKGAIAQFGCELIDLHQAGDHAILVGEIKSYAHCEGRPLLYHNGGYQELA